MTTDANPTRQRGADTNPTRQRGPEPSPSLTRRVGMYPLGEIAEITMGQSPPGSTYNRDGQGVPLLNGPAEFGERHPIPVQWTTEPSRFARKGDILFCVRGATTGRKCWSNQEYAIGRGLAAMRGRSGMCNTQYLWFLLDVVIDSLLKRAAGSTFINLPGEEILKFRVFMPPLAAQERIAARLTEQLAVVESAHTAAQARLAAAEALPAAYLREVFEGAEAEEWEARRLGDLIRRHNEIIHPGDRKSGVATFVGLEHVESVTGRRIGSAKIDLASLTGRKPTFRVGQIIYGYLRPYLNKVWIAEFDGCSSVDQFAFEVNCDVADTMFVAAFMRSDTFLRRSQVVTTTGQLPRISIDEIAAVKVNVPPTSEQRRIAADLALRLAEAERLTAILRDELITIEALPAASCARPSTDKPE